MYTKVNNRFYNYVIDFKKTKTVILGLSLCFSSATLYQRTIVSKR